MTSQLIYDDDHGTANEGWYLRLREDDGQEEDIILDATDRDDREAALAEAHDIMRARHRR